MLQEKIPVVGSVFSFLSLWHAPCSLSLYSVDCSFILFMASVAQSKSVTFN